MNHSNPSETSQRETPLQTVSGTRCCENIQKRQKCRSCHKDLHPCLCEYRPGAQKIAHEHTDRFYKHDQTICWKCCTPCWRNLDNFECNLKNDPSFARRKNGYEDDLNDYEAEELLENPPVSNPCKTCGNCEKCCSGENCVDCLHDSFVSSYSMRWFVYEDWCEHRTMSDDCSETSS